MTVCWILWIEWYDSWTKANGWKKLGKRKTIKEEKGQWKNIQCIIYLTLQWCVSVFWDKYIKTSINDQYYLCVCACLSGILYSCHHTNNLTRCTMIIILSLDFPLYCVKFYYYLGCRWVKCLQATVLPLFSYVFPFV